MKTYPRYTNFAGVDAKGLFDTARSSMNASVLSARIDVIPASEKVEEKHTSPDIQEPSREIMDKIKQIEADNRKIKAENEKLKKLTNQLIDEVLSDAQRREDQSA